MSRTNQLTAQIQAIAADLSGYASEDLIPTATFMELGFDSLFLTQLAASFQKEFKVKTTFRQLIEETPTIAALAAYLDKAMAPEPAPAPMPEPHAATADRAQPSAAPAPSPLARDDAARPGSGPAPLAAAAALPPHDLGLATVFQAQLDLMRQQIALVAGTAPAGSVLAGDEPALPAPALPAPALAANAAAAPSSAETQPEAPIALPKGFGPTLDSQGQKLLPKQQAHIDRLLTRYNAKTAQSKERTQIDRPYHADPRTAAGFNPLWKEMVYPLVVEKSLGARLWDVDGNEYVDFLNGFGPNYFGHRAPFIMDALKAQLDDGFEVGPQTPRAGEAAKLLCELTGMDRVSWVNTGSEAVQAAIRISRTVTGRDRIVVFSGDYHGNFDEVLVRATKTPSGPKTRPLAPGIPMTAVENVIVLDYGEDSALDYIAAHADDIAAVLVEPVQSRRPEFQPREFIHKLRDLTREREIVMVFDEVITGFRTEPGGAQAYYGIKADIATYGKIIGGGMPIGVVAGRANLMDTFDGGLWQYGDDSKPTAGVTFFAGTFVRHPLAIAAAIASLQYLKSAGPALQQGVNRKAARLAKTLNTFFEERQVKIHVAQFSSQMFVRVEEESDLATLFFYHMRDRGIHLLEGFPSYVTAAHTDEDIDLIIAAAKDSVLEMQQDEILPLRDGVSPVVRDISFPLTSGQKEIWIASELDANVSIAFNESDTILIEGPLDMERFVKATEGSLNDQQAFRLVMNGEGTTQRVDPARQHKVGIVDLMGQAPDMQRASIENLIDAEARNRFDLSEGPLIRVHLLRLAPDKHQLTLYAHHVVFDGYSADLLIRDIAARYTSGRGLPELASFDGLASLQNARGEHKKALSYWKDIYGGAAPAALDLPTDNPFPAKRDYSGDTVHAVFDQDLSKDILQTARRLGIGPSGLLLSSYAALLARLTDQEELVVGLPAAGQALHGVDAIGYAVNMLPLRLELSQDQSFSDLAKRVQKTIVAAAEHPLINLSDLGNALALPRDPRRPGLVQAVFNHSKYFGTIDLGTCKIKAVENPRQALFHELFLNMLEVDGQLVIDWEYSTALFDRETITRWISHLRSVLAHLSESPETKIKDLPLLSPDDESNVIIALRQGENPN